ncbi:MAG: Thioesterase [Promethearchaeota archaeon]|nr:MAG: Thioesterase [Candidatus Lokiarchaeota archaeon]
MELTEGYSKVHLKTRKEMIVDEKGLIHGGFIFSLADFAAMVAVNHPYVVLSSSSITFINPARLGDLLIAEATLTEEKGKKIKVEVRVKRNKELISTGIFNCYIPKQHVLEGKI